MKKIFQDKQELSKNIDFNNLTKNDIQIMYDLLSIDYPDINKLNSNEVAKLINEEWNIGKISSRDIEILRDITLNEEILDTKLLHKNLGLY